MGSSGSQSPGLGDMWRYGYPKSLDWDVVSWTESEGTSSEQCEYNVGSLALSWRKTSQVEGCLSLPHRPGYVVPGNAWAW